MQLLLKLLYLDENKIYKNVVGQIEILLIS